MKIYDIDVEQLALAVEREMERRLSWSSNALYIAGHPPRAVVRDEEAVDEDAGKSEAARAVKLLCMFLAGTTDDRLAAELALRFLWRWVYAPPFMSTSEADALSLFMMMQNVVVVGEKPEDHELIFVMRRVAVSLGE